MNDRHTAKQSNQAQSKCGFRQQVYMPIDQVKSKNVRSVTIALVDIGGPGGVKKRSNAAPFISCFMTTTVSEPGDRRLSVNRQFFRHLPSGGYCLRHEALNLAKGCVEQLLTGEIDQTEVTRIRVTPKARTVHYKHSGLLE